MKKTTFLLLFMICSLITLPVCGSDWGSFIVEEEEDGITPDRNQQASALMRLMTDEEKIGQLFFVTLEDLTGEIYTTSLNTAENVLQKYPVGGVALFGQNIVSEHQLMTLTQTLQLQAECAGLYPLLLAVSEEGGTVARVANKLGYPLQPSPAVLAAGGDPSAAREAGFTIAKYLSVFGIQLDFAPVADILSEPDSGLGDRAFGTDAATVSQFTSAMAAGLHEGGVTPCYLHFPGQGSAENNPDKGTASIRKSINELRTQDWVSFQQAIHEDAEMIMISHAVLHAAGDTVPSSLSPRVIQGILRNELGFSGVVITDSLRMNAITRHYSAGAAVVEAIKAGADLLLLPSDFEAALHAVEKAVRTGEIPMVRIEESVRRILALKIRMGLIQ